MLASGIRHVFAQGGSDVYVTGVGSNCGVLNGRYYYIGTVNGKPSYGKEEYYFEWTGTYWDLSNNYKSIEDVQYPWLASTWTHITGCSGLPTVTEYIVQPTPLPPTLTPTFHPLFPTQTPRPPGDYTCPGYQPIGAGTVTPAADWSLHCAQCITPISRYTWPTVPAMPTSNWQFETPTPTVGSGTPTPSPLGKMTVYMDVGVALPHPEPNIIVTHNSILMRSFGTTFHENWQDQWTLPKKFGVRFWGNTAITRQSGVATISYNIWSIGQHNVDLEVMESNDPTLPVGTIYHLTPSYYKNTTVVTIGSSWSATYDWDVTFNVTLLDHGSTFEEFFRFHIVPGGTLSAMTTEYNMEYQSNAWIDHPLPIVSDCSTIPTTASDDSDAPFKLPYIGVGEGQGISLGGWTIPTGWLQIFFPNAPDSFTLPGIELLFLPVEFGTLNLFGIPIDLDAMAFLMAGVVLIRILRS